VEKVSRLESGTVTAARQTDRMTETRCSDAFPHGTGASVPAYKHRVAISSINRQLWHTASVEKPIVVCIAFGLQLAGCRFESFDVIFSTFSAI